MHRNWSTGLHGHHRDGKPPSSTPRALAWPRRMVAQRPAILHRMRLVKLVSIDCIVYRHGLFELNYYYQNQINKALLHARPGQIWRTSTWATSVFLTSPGSVSRINPGNRNFLILVFLTGIMDSGVFLIFQRNRFGFFSYRWFFLLVSVCCIPPLGLMILVTTRSLREYSHR